MSAKNSGPSTAARPFARHWHFVAAAASLLAVYAVADLVLLNRWVWIFTQHTWYPNYYSAFLGALFLLVLLRLLLVPPLSDRLGRSVAFSTVSGYLAGLLGYVVWTLTMPGGMTRFVNSWRQGSVASGLMTTLGAPMILMSWLFGAGVGVVVFFARKRQPRGVYIACLVALVLWMAAKIAGLHLFQ